MKNIMIYIIFLFEFFPAFSEESPLAPVQLEKGYICGIQAGENIKDQLYDGAEVTVERAMGEESYSLKYIFHIQDCGDVSATTNDAGFISRISIGQGKFMTQEGARVGDPFSRLKKLYPEGKLFLPEAYYEGPEYGYYYKIDQLGFFEFDATAIMEKCGYSMDMCLAFLDGLKSSKFVTYKEQNEK
ncbi:MAG: hypothetical protein KDF58_00440 [Alphaproteobacteria bacterium]|mgnify:CR=1 FL=1|nr:hypothetical protein [Alphaproteobacteria bacterium]HPF47919.1 hypothetical protein [Emcibacteraceae bacterium]HRW30259.1 hypothetical protein [Emcibacteraceae bacterium]